MRKYSVLLLTLFLLIGCNSSKKIVEKSTAPTDNALLWKIEGGELEKPSYLFGTIHIIPESDFFWPKGTLSAIEATENMIFEIDMNEMQDPMKQMELMSKALMKDNKTLSDLLSDEDYKIVEDHFKTIGLPLGLFEKMKPAFLTIFTSPEMSPDAIQSGSMKSYEFELAEIAKNSNMTTGGLETIDYQMQIFDKIPYETQAQDLVQTIKTLESGTDEMDMMIDMYTNQNIQGLDSLFSDQEALMGGADMLLYDRNANWIPLIISIGKETPSFFAVGAGHLVGEKGVISLLRKQGLTITPVL